MLPPRLPACTKCGTALSETGFNAPSLCSGCGAELFAAVFPALSRGADKGEAPQVILTEGEAACYYHVDKRAVVPCAACGRFLCALCDVEIEGSHFCPSCLEAGAKNHGALLESKRIRYDHIVWSLLIFPCILCMLAVPITAVGAWAIALWKWRSPPSLVANTRASLATGMVVAAAELVVASLIWVAAFSR